MSNRNPEVDAWFASYDNPQKDLVLAVREIILDAAADRRMDRVEGLSGARQGG